MLGKTIAFLQQKAKDYRDVVHDEIGTTTLRGLSNTLDASKDIDHQQVNTFLNRLLIFAFHRCIFCSIQ